MGFRASFVGLGFVGWIGFWKSSKIFVKTMSGKKNKASFLHEFLNRPGRVAVFSVLFAVGSLLVSGSAFSWFTLSNDRQRLTEQIQQTKLQIADYQHQIERVKDPQFIEKQALDRLDFAEENDVVFVFSDE